MKRHPKIVRYPDKNAATKRRLYPVPDPTVPPSLAAALPSEDWDVIGNMLGQSLQQHMQQAQFHQKEIERIQPLLRKLQMQLQARGLPQPPVPQNGATDVEATPPPPTSPAASG